MTCKVAFLPQKRIVKLESGTTLLEAARSGGIALSATCGGRGVCGDCRVRPVYGLIKDLGIDSRPEHLSPLDKEEAVLIQSAGQRLACRARVLGDIAVAVPENREQVELGAKGPAAKKTACGESQGHGYGIAVDLGTTTLAAYLCNLKTGRTIARKGAANPQGVYGADVISRIAFACGGGLEKLRELAFEAVKKLVTELSAQAKIPAGEISRMVLVGNPVMLHILRKVSPRPLGVAPYKPAFTEAFDIPAGTFGLQIPVFCLPAQGGFVGADNTAAVLACGLDEVEDTALLMDIGTNGELNLTCGGKLLSTSCATGPAFEGAGIRCGMRASAGAIERVRIDPETFQPEIEIIGGGKAARGICGSGLIDAVAGMLEAGILEPSGRFSDGCAGGRFFRDANGSPGYRLAEREGGSDIVVTQRDIRAIQLAKAALRAGAELLMRRAGIRKCDRILLAGGMGSTVNPASALRIGMLPSCEKIESVGNAAGAGAAAVLIDPAKKARADAIASDAVLVSAAGDPDFEELFVREMTFPGGKA